MELIEEIKKEQPIKKPIGRPASANHLSKDPDYVKKYNKLKYEKNRLKLLEDAKIKIYCECCEKYVNNSNRSKHIKSEKHQLKLLLKQK